MKRYKTGIWGLALGLTTLSSCNKFLDVNVNPATPQSTQAGVLLAPILANMERGEAFDGRYIGQYVQYWLAPAAGNTYDRFGYVASSDALGEKWSTHYYRIGANIDLMVNEGIQNERWDFVGVAKAIRAWSWQTTTDVYGEMILKQAFDQRRSVFDFDPQPDVYAEVQRLAREALTYLNRTDGKVPTSNLGTYDLVYAGNRDKWKRFVYAVLAMNFHHQSNKSSYSADSVIKYVNLAFQSNADDFLVPHNGRTTDDANFWGPLRQNLNGFRQSDYMVRLLDGRILASKAAQDTTSDPRLNKMLTPSKDGVYRGLIRSEGDANSASNTSLIRVPFLWGNFSTSIPVESGGFLSKYIFRNDSKVPIISYAQLQFMRSEAAFKKGDLSTAYESYLKGISSNIDFVSSVSALPITATAKAAYLAGSSVRQNAASLTLSDIMQQKYIALFGWGNLETWVDMRRYFYNTSVYTGFALPNSPQTIFPDNANKLVYRCRPRYNSEYVWNFESLKKLGGDLPDYHTVQPWFILP